jgi:hypothetical protein
MSRDEEEQQSRGFKVEDRRRFTEQSEATHPDAHDDRPEEAAPAHRDAGATIGGEAAAAGHEPLPEVTFTTFVMGLTTQALMHLGEIADPVHQHVDRDLPAAKQMIDLLGILRDKTKGNLDPEEEQLLGSMLYDLRMRYVEVARGR